MSNYFRGHNYRCPPVKLVLVNYNRIAGNFRERKLSQIGEKYNFRGENFHRLLTFPVPKDTMPQNFAEKNFANSHKTTKFVKVFSPESFLLYSSNGVDSHTIDHMFSVSSSQNHRNWVNVGHVRVWVQD